MLMVICLFGWYFAITIFINFTFNTIITGLKKGSRSGRCIFHRRNGNPGPKKIKTGHYFWHCRYNLLYAAHQLVVWPKWPPWPNGQSGQVLAKWALTQTPLKELNLTIKQRWISQIAEERETFRKRRGDGFLYNVALSKEWLQIIDGENHRTGFYKIKEVRYLLDHVKEH